MNRADLVINVIISAISIFGVCWLVFWLLRDYLVDSFRERNLRCGLSFLTRLRPARSSLLITRLTVYSEAL